MRTAAAILTCVLLLTVPLPAHAEELSTSSDETVSFGPFNTSNWRSEDFKGTTYRAWEEDGNRFRFIWDTTTGNQIGSIGVSYGSSYLQNEAWEGVRISDLPEECHMSTDARWTPANNGWFFWSIYGWTHRTYTYWGSADAPNGHDVEFYIVFYTQETEESMLSQPGAMKKGSVEVDGMTFECYSVPRKHFTQWFAISRSDAWTESPSVNLKAIFDHWCAQGLDSEQYFTSLTWALEGFGGSAGSLQLENIKIPDLATGTVDSP